MAVISVLNNKGGVGKTTISYNLGAAISLHENMRYTKVLLVDLDPQQNLSSLLHITKSKKPHIADYFQDSKKRITELSAEQLRENLWAIPGSHDLSVIDAEMSVAIHENPACARDVVECLAEKINKARNVFHFIIIDCGPAEGNLMYNALQASDAYIVPINSKMSLSGMENLRRIIQANLFDKDELREYPLLSNVDKEAAYTEQLDDFMQRYPNRLQTIITHHRCLDNANNDEKTIYDYPLASFQGKWFKSAREEFDSLATEILEIFGGWGDEMKQPYETIPYISLEHEDDEDRPKKGFFSRWFG